MRTYIIAEAGVNHNGSLDMALSLIDAAVDAGVDAVKFQTFNAEQIVSKIACKAEYQRITTDPRETQVDMIRRLELDRNSFRKIRDYCQTCGIKFLSTPFDEDSLDFLVAELGMQEIKIPSGEITNPHLLIKAAKTGLPIILSTGMSFLGEVETALGALAYGYLSARGIPDGPPSISTFSQVYSSDHGQEELRRKVRLLHCTTEYPAPYCEVNLRAIATLHQAFGLEVGFSDHTQGVLIPCVAVGMGATIIEKHFTLDRSLPGPDHQASLEPDELKSMVAGIRQVENALGISVKCPSLHEWKNRTVARKSLVAAREISEGELLDETMIALKRPGIGISPMNFWEILGHRTKRSFQLDEVLEK